MPITSVRNWTKSSSRSKPINEDSTNNRLDHTVDSRENAADNVWSGVTLATPEGRT